MRTAELLPLRGRPHCVAFGTLTKEIKTDTVHHVSQRSSKAARHP
jgi:hypothetical protein